MEIKARRWLAVWYKCPNCGAQSGHPMLTPTKKHRDYRPTCGHWRCDCKLEVVERRYYTTFAIEAGVSFTTIAGTLEQIGPFKVCNIVHPNIRAFRKWVEKRREEVAEQSRKYMEEFSRIQAESEARLKRQREEEALLREVEGIAYRRAHAVELTAEKIASEVWPTDAPNTLERFDFDDDELGELDDHPF